ncbi:MAG: hypothetical protein QME42_10090 [bacterium]|nr:hypothetical protein [bacterium]
MRNEDMKVLNTEAKELEEQISENVARTLKAKNTGGKQWNLNH